MRLLSSELHLLMFSMYTYFFPITSYNIFSINYIRLFDNNELYMVHMYYNQYNQYDQPTTPTKSNVPRCIDRFDLEVTKINQATNQLTINLTHFAFTIYK